MLPTEAAKSKPYELLTVKMLSRLGVLGGLAIAVSVLESLIPQPLPWSKIGFANIVILLTLYLYGPLAAVTVASLKVFGGGLILGSGFSPAFWLAFSGTYASLIVMIPLIRLPKFLSPVGVAIAGSAAFNGAQLVMAGLLLVGVQNMLMLIPVMMVLSIITGGVVGWLTGWLLYRLTKTNLMFPKSARYADF
jgi:heptaprenyl diphosphate synthase